jgi:Flp pilus assembly protein TadG
VKLAHRYAGCRSQSIRRGAFTVEFALTIPIVFTLVFGVIELSRVVMLDNSTENAAYEGCRAAITPGATATKARTGALEILNAVGAQGSIITVSPATINDDVNEVTITVEIPINNNVWIATPLTSGLVLKHSCTLSRERTTRKDDQ